MMYMDISATIHLLLILKTKKLNSQNFIFFQIWGRWVGNECLCGF